MNKYRNKKTVLDGRVFDSKHEAERWSELKLLERAGEIRDLKRQVKFVLIPAQYQVEIPWEGIKGKLLERECSYIADFTYFQPSKNEMEELVVEDAKGMRTDVYKIKKKLMLQKYGIRIREV